jgi:hypothetical protein
MDYDDSKNSKTQYVVVIRAGSRLRFPPDEDLRLNVNIGGNNLVLTFRTRYVDEGFETHVPRELWVDARGSAPSLDEAVTEFTNKVIFFTTLISFCSNGFSGDCQFHLAYDNTEGKPERDFFEQFIEGERGAPRISRRINPELVATVIDVLGKHEYTSRLRRAIVQYVLALKYWSSGEEILSVAHLFMGMESLVRVVVKNELQRLNLDNPQQLAEYLGVTLKELDSTIRRQYLFQNDQDCHKDAKRASDAIEHGFLEFDEIRPLAIEVRNKSANYLRTAIIKLLNLSSQTEKALLAPPYDNPIGTEGYIRYLRGQLLSSSDQLAPDGFEYPIVDWKFSVNSFRITSDNHLQLSFSQSLTPRLAKGVSFQPKSFEIYGPEGIVSNPLPEPRQLEAKLASDTPNKAQVSTNDLSKILSQLLREGNFEELRIITKEQKTIVITAESAQSED